MALKNKKGNHIIVSGIEDFPVLNSAKSLEKHGFDVTYLEVDESGLVDPKVLKNPLEKKLYWNLSTCKPGNRKLQDIKAMVRSARKKELFHTNATHTFTKVPLDVNYYLLIL